MSNRINLGKVAFVDKGVYSEETEYAKFDFVSNGRSTFYSRKDGNTGNALPSTAEEAEASEWWGFLANAEEAQAAADAAAEDVRSHTPTIVDGYWALWNYETEEYDKTEYKATGKSPYLSDAGTWMVFDDDTQSYTDSGVSASSGYSLTKAAVESVLTGDITTHTHDAQYYTKEEVDAKTTVDSELSSESKSPVQNKAVNAKIADMESSISSLETAVENAVENMQNTLTAGKNITIEGNVISATDTTYEEATEDAAGLMSAEDKASIEELKENAGGYVKKENTFEGSSAGDTDYITVYDTNGIMKLLQITASGSDTRSASIRLKMWNSTKKTYDKEIVVGGSVIGIADNSTLDEVAVTTDGIILTDGATGTTKTITATSEEGGPIYIEAQADSNGNIMYELPAAGLYFLQGTNNTTAPFTVLFFAGESSFGVINENTSSVISYTLEKLKMTLNCSYSDEDYLGGLVMTRLS